MGVSKHETDIATALIVKDFRGEVVGVSGAVVAVAVKPVTNSVKEGKAIALQVVNWKDMYIKLKGDPVNDDPAVPEITEFDGLMLPALAANTGQPPHMIKLAPTVQTVWLYTPLNTSAHLSWFIGG